MESSCSHQTVYVIDDDPDVRDSLQWLLESVGLQVRCFGSALDFFAAFEPGASGCIVMDVRMPGMSGLNAQKKLQEYCIDLPVIMISAHGNVDMAVSALTQGATTFIEKPFDDQLLIDHVHRALVQDQKRCERQRVQARKQRCYDSLTRREKQVFGLVVKGLSNQEAAEALNINRKTVEGHRANMIAKMKADSLAELVQIAVALGIIDSLES